MLSMPSDTGQDLWMRRLQWKRSTVLWRDSMRSIPVQLLLNIMAGHMYYALLVTKPRLSLRLLRAAAAALHAHSNLAEM